MTAPSRVRLQGACEELATRDLALARAYRNIGVPEWRVAEPTYETLARIVTHQLISTKAAAAIWGRLKQLLGQVSADSLLETADDELRACGQSRPKIGHLKSIAEAVAAGTLDLDQICTQPLDIARSELVAVKGIGPWTAEVFLLSCAGAEDAFPAGDVGLMESLRLLDRAEVRLDAKAFAARAEGWRPLRGVAAHLLWCYLNAKRQS